MRGLKILEMNVDELLTKLQLTMINLASIMKKESMKRCEGNSSI
jgi:hypothetical protein